MRQQLRLLAMAMLFASAILSPTASSQTLGNELGPLSGDLAGDEGLSSSKRPRLTRANGEVHMVWDDFRGSTWQVWRTSTAFSGTTWSGNATPLPKLSSTAHARQPAIAGSGQRIVIAWTEVDEVAGIPVDRTVASTSLDGGATFGAPMAVDSIGASVYSSPPSVAVAPNGRFYVAWSQNEFGAATMDHSFVTGDRGYVTWSDDGVTWDTPDRVERDLPGFNHLDVVNSVRVVATNRNNAAVVFLSNEETTPDNLRFRAYSRRLVGLASDVTVSSAIDLNLGTNVASLDVASDGLHVAVACADNGAGTILVQESTDGAATYLSVSPVPAPASCDPSYPFGLTNASIAIANGNVHIGAWGVNVAAPMLPLPPACAPKGWGLELARLFVASKQALAGPWTVTEVAGLNFGANFASSLPAISVAARGEEAAIVWTQFAGPAPSDEFDITFDQIFGSLTDDAGLTWSTPLGPLDTGPTSPGSPQKFGGAARPQAVFQPVGLGGPSKVIVVWDDRRLADGAPELFSNRLLF